MAEPEEVLQDAPTEELLEESPLDQLAEDTGMDPLAAPVPGESLTNDPDAPAPYETEPTFTDTDKAMEALFMNMTEDENIDGILDLIRAEMPLEDIAQVVLFGGFREGMYNPDLMLMMIEPTIYILIWLADYAGIEAVLYPEDEFDFAAEGEEVPRELAEQQLPTNISPTLLDKVKGQLEEK